IWPICGLMVKMMEIKAPATAAMAEPRAKVMNRTCRTSIPHSWATCGCCDVARIDLPKVDCFRNVHIAPVTIIAMMKATSRDLEKAMPNTFHDPVSGE